MDKFNELCELIDCENIREKVSNQHYIDLMDKLAQLRGVMPARQPNYLVDIKIVFPVLQYTGSNGYTIHHHYRYESLVFNQRDICRVLCNDRQFDETEFLASTECNITDDGLLEYNNTTKFCKDFILHDSECDDFGSIGGNCDCITLEHNTTTTKIKKIEKL